MKVLRAFAEFGVVIGGVFYFAWVVSLLLKIAGVVK